MFDFKLNNWLENALNILLPHRCLVCHTLTQQNTDLCNTCHDLFTHIDSPCAICGLPSSSTAVCGECLTAQRSFDELTALWSYEGLAKTFIGQLKFGRQLKYAETIGKLLSAAVTQQTGSSDLPKCIVPVPLHKKRQTKRGFNQSLEIAKPIAKALKIPINTQLCRRISHTASQATLSRPLRQQNLARAFTVLPNQTLPRHIAIVDDVVTTCSTVNALSQHLKASGVEKISIWCCARTTH